MSILGRAGLDDVLVGIGMTARPPVSLDTLRGPARRVRSITITVDTVSASLWCTRINCVVDIVTVIIGGRFLFHRVAGAIHGRGRGTQSVTEAIFISVDETGHRIHTVTVLVDAVIDHFRCSEEDRRIIVVAVITRNNRKDDRVIAPAIVVGVLHAIQWSLDLRSSQECEDRSIVAVGARRDARRRRLITKIIAVCIPPAGVRDRLVRCGAGEGVRIRLVTIVTTGDLGVITL